jgi:hypothetical protein
LSGVAGAASSVDFSSSPFGASAGRGCGNGIFPVTMAACGPRRAARAGAPQAASTSRMTAVAIADRLRKKRQ